MALLPPVRIPALPHPVCLVDALADSPVAWSRRMLDLSDNRIVSVAGVSWPSSLQYASPRWRTLCVFALSMRWLTRPFAG